MDKPIIEISNLGKKYGINHAKGGYVALRDVLANVFRSPFSFLLQKTKQVVGIQKKDEFWALKDFDLQVQKGEVVGIIGANGAGKSTLLKILSQITPPSTGEVILRGKVGSLLEVGTGFHPELTGRENIFLNGAILGMKKHEIEKKFDRIVEFAGISKFLDTVVKHYSSGMYVRLAFSVAAHMEPDILLIDEVLAVGDAEFQKKCLGKMDEITKTEGRTILFVSHNMEAIRQICAKCVLLENGRVKSIGKTDDIVTEYLNQVQKSVIEIPDDPQKIKEAKIRKVVIRDSEGRESHSLGTDKPFFIEMEYELFEDMPAYAVVKISKASIPNTHLLVSLSGDNNQATTSGPGKYKSTVKIEPIFNAGNYSLLVGVATNSKNYLDRIIEPNVISINNSGKYSFSTANPDRTDSLLLLPLEWKTEMI